MTELSNLGLNALTISLFGTILFTIIESLGVLDQSKQIWKNRSGASVPSGLFIFNFFMFAVILIYGVSVNSLALKFSGIVVVPAHIPVVLGLHKFKGFSFWEKVSFWVLTLVLLLDILLPYATLFFFFLSLIAIGIVMLQPYEIWKRKSSGVVSIKMLWAYWAGTAFWIVYGFSFNEWALKATSSFYLLLTTISIILWYKYNTRE